ncbi:hypothetical protein [Paenibacillus lactis]|uniref:hypothetical protein n=1 Tax=Paenibacillus lactis TaxID=228574 RepID=UPI0036C9513E
MSLDNMKIEVVGGQMSYAQLNTKVDPRVYAIGKAHIWLDMINKRKRPKKWNKPNAKGTKVTFEMINSDESLDAAFSDLEMYLKQINEEHGTDITLNREGR